MHELYDNYIHCSKNTTSHNFMLEELSRRQTKWNEEAYKLRGLTIKNEFGEHDKKSSCWKN